MGQEAHLIPHLFDAGLHARAPWTDRLHDGFPAHSAWRIAAATHPVEPEPLPSDDEPAAPNPSHLPVEPEFGPLPPAAEPEDPFTKPPRL
jgi:hypothetical protein